MVCLQPGKGFVKPLVEVPETHPPYTEESPTTKTSQTRRQRISPTIGGMTIDAKTKRIPVVFIDTAIQRPGVRCNRKSTIRSSKPTVRAVSGSKETNRNLGNRMRCSARVPAASRMIAAAAGFVYWLQFFSMSLTLS